MSGTIRTSEVRQLWPLLSVENIQRSVQFYTEGLGFRIVGEARAEGNLFWCRLERGGASLMLEQQDDEDDSSEERGRGVTLYFVCDDADALYEEFSARGLSLSPPTLAYYGMKQLCVPEPDGYSVWFESVVPGEEN